MLSNCDMTCKEKTELFLKFVFVAVFTWGVMSAVCCMKSCSRSCSVQSSGCKAAVVDTVKQPCGQNCQKDCCKN